MQATQHHSEIAHLRDLYLLARHVRTTQAARLLRRATDRCFRSYASATNDKERERLQQRCYFASACVKALRRDVGFLGER